MSDNLDQADDLFADTRMSFGDHLEVLRWHLWRAIFGFFVAVCLSLFCFGRPVMEFIAAPVSSALMKFYKERVVKAQKKLDAGDSQLIDANKPTIVKTRINRKVAEALGWKLPNEKAREDLGLDLVKESVEKKDGSKEEQEWLVLPEQIFPVEQAIAMETAGRLVGRPPTLATLTITEGFVVYLQVGIYCGIVLASPWIFYQIWSFIAAGLYAHEKRLVNVYLPISLTLFLGGVVLCEFLVMPVAVEYLLSFNEWLGLEPDLRLSNWLSFAIMMPLIFGVAFQTPLVMFILCRLGIVEAKTFARWRRYAIFGLACLAAILSASPDLISFGSLAIPLCLLYELGIVLCRFVPPAAPEIEDAGDEENPLGV
jgi:sec-independent protein translocase protein TatC